MKKMPGPNVVFPNEYKTSCFIKNAITAPNITVGDYTYYDDARRWPLSLKRPPQHLVTGTLVCFSCHLLSPLRAAALDLS